MYATPQTIFLHIFLDHHVTACTRLRTKKTLRPNTNYHHNCIAELRYRHGPKCITFGMNHTVRSTATDAILADCDEFAALEDHSYMSVNRTMLSCISIPLCHNIGIDDALRPHRQSLRRNLRLGVQSCLCLLNRSHMTYDYQDRLSPCSTFRCQIEVFLHAVEYILKTYLIPS